MKFKLDENFGTRTQQLFRTGGHDVQTVRDEGLRGSSDQYLYEVCCTEQRCLVTLDLDFADTIRFPPNQAGGVVVIRVPRNPSLALLERLIRQFLQALTQMSVEKLLWIVEVGRIRVHQLEGDKESGFEEKTDNSG
jgi:predicted nuclease of predicted toxin-antitoxin system